MGSSGNKRVERVKFWIRIILGPVAFVSAVAVFIAGLVALAIWIPFAFCGAQLGDFRLRRALKREGRLLDWTTVERRLANGEGTLLVDLWQKGLGKAWWVPMSLAEMYPDIPLPTLEAWPPGSREGVLDMWGRADGESTRQWVAENLWGHEDTFCLTRMPKQDRKNIQVLGKRLGSDRAFLISAVREESPTRRIRPKSLARYRE